MAESPSGEDALREPAAPPPRPGWQEVSVGHDVALYKKGQGFICGEVDAITADGAVIWVQLARGGGRRMFSDAEGYRLRRRWSETASGPDSRAG